jgi:lysyl endopeptidase
LFWNSPAGSESGWGINFAHQGDVIFATWFTYDLTGKAWWLSMTAGKTGNATYAGTLYQTTGPAFNVSPFSPATVRSTSVGSGTLTFSDVNNGTFAYNVNGIAQTKSITRQVFGPVPACVWNAQPNLASATNFQDLWWAAPAGVESGWGINFTQQGSIIFATWFTYGGDGSPLWLSVTAPTVAPDLFSGTLYSTTGPPFNAAPFLSASVVLTPTGTATFSFANGNSGTFSYTVNTPGGLVAQTKAITRQVFRTPGTVCR